MKKLLSLILAICLLLSVAPTTLSEETQPEEEVAVTAAAPEADADTNDPAEAPDPEPAPAPAEVKEEEAAEPAPAPAEVKEEEDAPAPAEGVKEEEPAAAPAEEVEEEAETAPAPAEEKQDAEVTVTEDFDESPMLVSNGGPDRLTDIRFTNAKPNEVTLEWDAPASSADDYEVRWGTAADYSAAAATSVFTGGAQTYTVTGLSCGTDYWFCVRGVFKNGSAITGWAKEYWEMHTPAPSAPTSFTFDLAPDSAVKLDFSWNRVDEADGYKVFRVVNGTENLAFTLSANPSNPSKTWGNITPADELTFRVYSYKTVKSKQILSADYDEYTLAYRIPAPNDLKVVSQSSSSVSVSWKKVEGVTTYILERDDGDGDYKVIATQTGTSYTDTGLTFGKEYTYYVTAWIGDVEGLTTPGVDGMAKGVPPTNVKVVNADKVDPDTGYIYNTVTWNAVPDVKGYELAIEWTDSSDTFHSETKDVGSVLTYKTYEDGDLEPGIEYAYCVYAYVIVNGNRVYTDPSKVVSVIARPPMPENLKLLNTDYETQDLTWDAVPGANGYEVEFSTNSSFTSKTTKDCPSETFTHEKCKNATKYYYRVRAYVDSSSGKRVYGPYSAVKSLQCAPPLSATVSAPYVPGSNSIKVEWDLVPGATDYKIYSKENDGAWTLLTTVKATTEATQSYTAKNLHVGGIYLFAVSAVRTSDGKTSTGQKAENIEGPQELAVKDFIPTDLQYSVVSKKSVTLSWKKVKGISLYAVTGECYEDPEFKDKFGEKEASTNSIKITGLKPGYNYIFTVRSKVVVDNVASYSDPADLYDVVPTSLAPANLTAKAAQKQYAVILTWSKSDGADGYIIQQAQSQDAPDSDWETVAQIANPDVLTYTDTEMHDWTHNKFCGQMAGAAFFYRVISYIDHGGEQLSVPTAAVKVLLGIPKPVIETAPAGKNGVTVDVLNAGDIDNSQINYDPLSIGKVAKFYIYRSTKKSSGFVFLDTVDTGSLPYLDNNDVKFGTVYYYKVIAAFENYDDVEVKSPWSAVVAGQGKLDAVTGVTILQVHGGSIQIGWNPLTGATGYDVYYKAEGGNWTLSGSVGKTTYKKLVTGLNPKSEYTFRVVGTAKAGSTKVPGNTDPLEEVTDTTAMEAVTGVTITPVSSTSVTVKWTSTKDATKYQVYIEDPNDPGVWTRKATVATNTATLTGLATNKSYNFKVRAYIKRNGITDYGAYSTDESGYTAPAKVTGLKASTIMASKVILSWTKSADADGYLIQWAAPGENFGDDPLKEKTVGNTKSAVIDGLTGTTKYRFRIIPFGYENSVQLMGVKSATLKVTTK